MRQRYFTTVMASEVKRLFPGIELREGVTKKIMTMAGGMLIMPLLIFKTCFSFTIPYVEIVLTSGCNLNCKGCANLMPLYKSGVSSSTKEIKSSIEALLSVSSEITEMTFIGGEPFLYAKLHEVINFAASHNEIKKIKLTTNGSIIPTEDNLKCLKKEKVLVFISNYPFVNSKDLIAVLEKNKIRYQIAESGTWCDYGDPTERNMAHNTLCRSYEQCSSANCKTIFMSKMYACPRSAHGNQLNLFAESQFIDLLNTPVKKLRKSIRKFYAVKYIAACNYCTPVWERKQLKCGEQMERE